MKKISTRIMDVRLSLAFITLVAFFGAGRANPESAAPLPPGAAAYRNAIQSAYTVMTAAFVDNHLDRSSLYFATDYRQVDPHGHILDKDGSQKKFQSLRDQINTVQSLCTVASMNAEADGIHVEMATHSAGTGTKRVLFFKVSGTFTNDLRVSDVWVDTPDGWRLKSRLMLEDLSVIHSG